MNLVITVGVFLLLAFSLVFGQACVQGDFVKEAALIYDMAWGKVTLFDLYIGLFLFGAFVFYMETSKSVAFIWIIFILSLGNLVSLIYLFCKRKQIQILFQRSLS